MLQILLVTSVHIPVKTTNLQSLQIKDWRGRAQDVFNGEKKKMKEEPSFYDKNSEE